MKNGSLVLSIIFTVVIISLFSIPHDAFAVNVDIDIPINAQVSNCFTFPNTCYNPDNTIVNQYDTVTWTNLSGGQTHTATSGSPGSETGVFNTGNISPLTTSIPIIMDVVGTHDYYCQIHPWQVGTITVVGEVNTVSIPLNAGDLNCSTNVSPNPLCYNPKSLAIQLGQIVKWTNNDSESHTTTSGTAGAPTGYWDSGPLTPLQTFSLDSVDVGPGVYPYYCKIHPWQVGTVTILDTPTYHTVEIPSGSSLPGIADPLNDCTSQGPNACYNPDTLTVTQGDIITWTNNDLGIQHTTTSDFGLWDSGSLSSVPGLAPFSFSLDTTGLAIGTHPYHCSIHPWQVGSITILDQLNFDPIHQKIQKGTITIGLEPFVTGLASPVQLTHVNDGTGDVYIADQPGIIYRADSSGTLQSTPFLDITSKVYMPGFFGSQNANDYDERGLLGLAFHPGYNTPGNPGEGVLYTFHSEIYPGSGIADFPITMTGTPDNIGVVTEWKVDPASVIAGTPFVDMTSERRIMTIEEPQFNHAGGMMQFVGGQQLFIAIGDGGAANDEGDGHTAIIGNSQDESNLLGSILRIDPLCLSGGDVSANGKYCIPSSNPNVGVPGQLDEIYANGFRNPWRFDATVDPIIVADVGQNQIEEIDILTLGGNYGWNEREGTFGFDDTSALINNSPTPFGMTDPIAQYDHDEGISITGGYLYQGSAIPELQDKYVFGDFSSSFFGPAGRLFYLSTMNPSSEILELRLSGGDVPLGKFVKSFGEDEFGEVYVMAGSSFGPFTSSGQILKIVADTGGGLTGSTKGQVDIVAAPTCGISFVSGNPISYGALIPGQESDVQQLILDNTGDVSAILFVRGGDWLDDTNAPQMLVSDTHYDLIENDYGLMTALTSSDIPIGTPFDPINDLELYWILLANIVGSFQGSLTQTVDFSVSC